MPATLKNLDGILEAVGYIKTDKEDEADFVIYNTCTVRENANQRVYGRLGYLGSMKNEETAYDDRALRLYDAGSPCGRKS